MTATTPSAATTRRVLVVSHFAREDAIESALSTMQMLDAAGIIPVIERDTPEVLGAEGRPRLPKSAELLDVDCSINQCEIVIVLGGDGTILLAVELARAADVPVLGVNLGHVGFLAESEKDALSTVVERVIDREYDVEERLTVEFIAETETGERFTGWALNEVSVEKGNRERMLDAVIEVDGEPLSSFGCDGVLFATPTGSSAYSFSSGGPVVWPQVEALLLVPVSAHALFARPLVTAPDSTLAVEVYTRDGSDGIIWCDGRRSHTVPSGTRITVTRSSQPVRLARLHQVPFTTRLVKKFQLPIVGWRGPR